jgi:hypothetical protein
VSGMSLNTSVLGLPPGRFGFSSGAASQPAGTILCPSCNGYIAPAETPSGWQNCPYCEQRLQVRLWPVVRRPVAASEAMPEQATCFFHPDKAFQACCQRCGRFVCALCDLQLGAEHVCPTCFERGRGDARADGGKSEWRLRDVHYDSIALTIGWAWLIVWPSIIGALPAVIILHVKYRKAPRSYLLPRSGWRFWVAYVGFVWAFVLISGIVLIPRWIAGRP